MNKDFPNFKDYSRFLLNNYLDSISSDNIEKAKKINIPVLRILSHLSEEEILEMSKRSLSEEILIPILQGDPFRKMEESIKAWKTNATVISKEQLDINDITSINYIRKLSLFDYIKFYDCSKDTIIALVKEIEEYFEVWINASVEAYKEIQQSIIKDKNEIVYGLLTHFPIIVTRVDKDGTFLQSFGAGLKSLGLKDNDLNQTNVFENYPEAVNTREVLENEKPLLFIGKAKAKNGEVRFFQNYFIPGENGALGFSIDITDQKLAEERFKLLVDGVKDYAIFMLSKEGKIVYWNKGAKRLLGYSENEILGKHFSIFYPMEAIERKYPDYELEEAKKRGQYEDEGLRFRKDHTTFFANVLITALYDENKQLIGFSKIVRDLTEKKQIEENLYRLNAELEKRVHQRTEELSKKILELKKINTDLDNFIYTASHDLKAPISNIEGLLIALYDEIEQEPNDRENVGVLREMIDKSIKKFQETIRDLTEISKVQKDLEGQRDEINLTELLEDVKVTVTDLIVKNNTTIIDNTKGCGKVKFIKKNLNSILYNLISNAIKYRDLHRDPVVKVSCSVKGDYYLISVSDNGLGIKEEYKPKLFQMFKRLHNHVEGTGVGLYIVKRIIENAGGKIEVESVLGEGSTFNVYIPIIH